MAPPSRAASATVASRARTTPALAKQTDATPAATRLAANECMCVVLASISPAKGRSERYAMRNATLSLLIAPAVRRQTSERQ